MKAILALMLAGGMAALSGCIVHAHNPREVYYHRHNPGVEVMVPVYHVHDPACGHYYYRDRWYYRDHHRHGPGCGHAFVRGRWTLGI